MRRSEAWLRTVQGLNIRTQDRRIVPLNLLPPQRVLFGKIADRLDRQLPIRIIILKARREGFCLDPSTRILKSDLTWCRLADVCVGDHLVAVDEEPPRGKKGPGRKMLEAVVQSRRLVEENAVRLVLEDGRTLIATGQHRFLSRRRGGTDTRWRAVRTFRVGDVIRTVTEPWDEPSYEDGWFSGLMDGEAHTRRKEGGGCEMTLTQLPGEVYDRALKYLKDREYHPRESLDWYPRSHPKDGYNRKPIGRIYIGRMNELFRLLGQTRPTRIPATWWQGKDLPGKKSGVAWVRVVSIEPLGRRTMIDLQTSTRTFLAEGLVSHNSTLIEGLLFTMVLMHDLVNAVVMAHNAKAAKRIWEMSRRFVTTSAALTNLCKVGTNQIAAGRSVLEVSTAGSPDSERGSDITALHLSEAAFYEFPEVMLAILQCVPHLQTTQTLVAIESTANKKTGSGKLFYDEWTRAVAGKTDFLPMFFGFQDDPRNVIEDASIEDPDEEEAHLRARLSLTDAQLAWRRWAIENKCQGSVDKFHQEYPSTAEEAFIASGLPFFGPAQLRPLEADLRDGKKVTIDGHGEWHRDDRRGYLEVFVPPQKGRAYLIAGNASQGSDDDDDSGDAKETSTRAAAQVIDMQTMEQVAEYDADLPPHVFAKHLVSIGRRYHNALIATEVSTSHGGGGRELIVYLREAGYHNLHRWHSRVDAIQRQPAQVVGWETNARTWPRVIARMREAVMEQTAVIHSRRLFQQLTDFGEKDAWRFIDAFAGDSDLLVAWGAALVSRSENYIDPLPPALIAPRDFSRLGITIKSWETAGARLQRLLASDRRPTSRSFLEG